MSIFWQSLPAQAQAQQASKQASKVCTSSISVVATLLVTDYRVFSLFLSIFRTCPHFKHDDKNEV